MILLYKTSRATLFKFKTLVCIDITFQAIFVSLDRIKDEIKIEINFFPRPRFSLNTFVSFLVNADNFFSAVL